ASIAFDGRVNYDETMSFEMEAAGVLIKPWIHLFRPEVDVDGYLSGSTRVGGTFMSPVIDLTASIDSLTYRDLTLGDLTAGVKYADRLLTADSLIVSSQPGVYRAAGQFHIDLAMTAGNRDLVPDLPMNIAVSARDTRFDLVSLILPSVEDLQGEFLADFSITGTPTAPHLDGQGYLKNGRLKYFDIADTLKTDSAGVTMENNLIVIDDITTYVYDKKRRRNSYATLEGTLTVKSLDTLHYDLDVTLEKEFPFRYELDDIEGVVEGELHIEGDTPPLVEGDLTLLSCRYRAEFASEDETGSPLMMALSGENTWDLNLNIDILSNYWIKNEDIDAEFAGFMNLIRENGRYRFIGDLEILKGRGYLFDKTFQIESGSMVIFEDIEYPNPRLDITAQTRIPVSSQTEEEDEPRNIDLSVHIGGTLENPELSAAEGETALGNEEILPLLFANYYGSEAGTVGRFEERISQLISARFSQIGTRRLGVEVFEIDPTYEGQLDLARTRVTLGVYTSPKLYLYGTSSVSLDRAQEVGFEYRLSKAFQLEGRRDEDELYHLNLKLHWEFE
ncbi:MAG: translocation/assembly module TamB, partial [candidate division Zixibacteria bacterium]|nr:translocation/assembly module TamB [candidate division Zixibacteria bacterium]